MASVNYMTQVLFSLGMVSNILNTAVRAVASAGRVEEVLSEVPAQRDVEEGSRPERSSGKEKRAAEVRFENVTFAYGEASCPAVENISFTVKSGETLGIIGPTGGGKSTLVQLVPRFYDVQKGRVLVDGMDVKEWNMNTLRQKIGVAPQKALLFQGTIAENLRWGLETASMEEIREAVRIACADGFVTGFSEGYDTILGQGGVNLSGGQKQRLSLARALLKKPEVLILDDCTSALDATTEAAVLGGLRDNISNMTVLLISQRISTVMRADRILCMEDGEIKGIGTHQELMEQCSTYQAIYASQIGGDQVG